MASPVRLPGVYIESQPPPLSQALPRMDITAFVGFSASGPLHVPVPLTDAARFSEIFGKDLQLARDPATGTNAIAQLAPAVRAFFRNGGVKCWVVRVAGAARTAEAVLPGVLRATADGVTGPAWCVGRSAGKWASRFALNTAISERGVPVASASAGALRFRDTGAGDLVRLRYEASGVESFLPVDATGRSTLGTAIWFRAAHSDEILGSIAGIVYAGPPAEVLAPLSLASSGGALIIVVARSEGNRVSPGGWIRASLLGGIPLSAGVAWFRVEGREETTASGGVEAVAISCSALWVQLEAAAAASSQSSASPQASVVAVELWSADSTGGIKRLGDCGLAPGSDRYLGDLPSDKTIFENTQRKRVRPSPAFLVSAAAPRFDWASPDESPFERDGAGRPLYIPLGVTAVARDDFYQPGELGAGLPLELDGLSAFDPAVFVDPEISRYGPDSLLAAATNKQYERRVEEPLLGIHSLLPLDEVSILAVPDATQTPWTRVVPGSNAVAGPELAPLEASGDEWHASWTEVESAIEYELQGSSDPLFGAVEDDWRAEARESAWPAYAGSCEPRRFYRVRAIVAAAAGLSPWSNTRPSPVGAMDFHKCARTPARCPGSRRDRVDGPAAQTQLDRSLTRRVSTRDGLDAGLLGCARTLPWRRQPVRTLAAHGRADLLPRSLPP